MASSWHMRLHKPTVSLLRGRFVNGGRQVVSASGTDEGLTGPIVDDLQGAQGLTLTRRILRFAAIGVAGSVTNVLALLILTQMLPKVNYLIVAIAAAEISILQNFAFQEVLVFRDLVDGSRSRSWRLSRNLLFNNFEALLRLPLLAFFVGEVRIWIVPAQLLTLMLSFAFRFVFLFRVLYRRRAGSTLYPTDS